MIGLRLSWTDPANWAFLLGVYRFGDSITVCLILCSVSFKW
jgi:hypothetical protein